MENYRHEEDDGARDQRRAAILEGLRDVPHLPSLFAAAIGLRHQDGNPARRYILGVAIREIRNKLPDLLDPVEQFQRSNPSAILLTLLRNWIDNVRPQLSDLGLPGATDGAAMINLPLPLASELDRAFQDVESVRTRQIDRLVRWMKNRGTPGSDADLTLSAAGLLKPNADEYVHVPVGPEAPAEDAILADWDQFEVVLFSIVGRPLVRLAHVDDDLTFWNAGYD
jgi:hypothetical protein